MNLKKRLQKRVTMTVLQRQCMIIVTLLSTLLLLTIWPRFHADAMSFNRILYLILIVIFAIPLFRRN